MPIHPDLPLARQRQLFVQGGGNIVLTTADLRDRALALSSTGRFVYDVGEVQRYEQGVEEVAIDPEQTAVLLSTSGSTGRPKLVMRTHGATLFNVWNNGHGLYLETNDRYGLTAFLGYGAGCSNSFNTLLAGATLVNLQVEGRTATDIIGQMRELQVTKCGLSAPVEIGTTGDIRLGEQGPVVGDWLHQALNRGTFVDCAEPVCGAAKKTSASPAAVAATASSLCA